MELETYRKLKEEKCALEIRVKKEENEIKIFNNKIKELNQKVKQIKKGILVGGISLPIMSFIASIPPCIIINIPDKLLLFNIIS